jgi:hypothetical protein
MRVGHRTFTSMSTTGTDPAVEYSPQRSRRHLTAGDWARGFLFLTTVVIVAGGAILGFTLVFGLLFNAYTIHFTLFFLGALAFRHGFIERRNLLAVAGTATARVHAAAIGLVELSGRVHVERPSEAPITGTVCAFWRVEVRQKADKSFKSIDLTWTRVDTRSSGPLDMLVLEDETGRMPVWGREAEIIPVRQVWRSDRDEAPEGARQLLAAMGREWPPLGSRHPMKVTEERIEQDGPLYVMGTLAERHQIPAARAGVFHGLLDRWAPPAPATSPQRIDSLRGTVTHARKVGLRWFANDLRPLSPVWSPPEMNRHDVLVWKGTQRRPFIISGVSEPAALSVLSRRAWLYLLGGAGAMTLMLWEFVEKLTGNMRW